MLKDIQILNAGGFSEFIWWFMIIPPLWFDYYCQEIHILWRTINVLWSQNNSQFYAPLLWTILSDDNNSRKVPKLCHFNLTHKFCRIIYFFIFFSSAAKLPEFESLIDWIKPLWGSGNFVPTLFFSFYCSLMFLSDQLWVKPTWWSTRWK